MSGIIHLHNNKEGYTSPRARLTFLVTQRIQEVYRSQDARSTANYNRQTPLSFLIGKSGRTWLSVMISSVYVFYFGLKTNIPIGFDMMHHKSSAIPKLFISHDNSLKDYTVNVNNKADFYDSKVVM